MSRSLVVAVALLVALAATACGGPGGTGEQRLTVLAASSLTEAFEELAARFEEEHPGVRVDLVLESSASLAEQVRQGAPGDVLATADEQTMGRVRSADLVRGTPVVFATNHLVLAVPAGGGDGAEPPAGLDDLDDPDVDYVVCVPEAPCGRVAAATLAAAGVRAPAASEEVDVKAVLQKVLLGEADAGLVYATDVRATAGQVRGVDLGASPLTVTRYPAAVLRDAAEPRLARDWLDLLRSGRGRRVLADAGFGLP